MAFYKNDKQFTLDDNAYGDGLTHLYEAGYQDFDFNAYVYDNSYPNWMSAEADDALHCVSDGLQGYSQAMDLSYTVHAMNKATGVPKKLVYFLDSSYGEALQEYRKPKRNSNYNLRCELVFDVVFASDWWQCECNMDFLHLKSERPHCKVCNSHHDESADATAMDVIDLLEINRCDDASKLKEIGA